MASVIILPFLAACQGPGTVPEPGTFLRSGAISLDVATSKPAYKAGETFSFSVTPSEDCHLAAWVSGADGKTTRLFPNAHESGRVFKKGVRAVIPGGGPFRFKVTPPAGRETLVVVASSRPLPAGGSPPSAGWAKGVEVEGAGTRGEARVVYEVVP